MILDNNALLSDAQAIVASAASTDVYDLGAPGKTGYNKVQLRRRMGKDDEKIPLLIQVVEAFNSLTSLTFSVQVSSDAAFSSPITVMSQTVLLANLKKGYISSIDGLPRGVNERYVRIFYTVAGTAPTLGKVTAGFVGSVDGAYKGNV